MLRVDDDATNQFKLRGTRRAINKLKLLGRDLTDDDVEESALRRILGSKFKVGSNKETIKKIQEIHESGDLDRLRTYRADPRRCAIMSLQGLGLLGTEGADADRQEYLVRQGAQGRSGEESQDRRGARAPNLAVPRRSAAQGCRARRLWLIGDRVRSCAKAVFAELLPSHDVAKLKVEGAPAASRFADRASISRRWRRRRPRRSTRPASAARRRAQVPWVFRRGQPDCGDVDVLVTHEDWLDDPERQLVA